MSGVKYCNREHFVEILRRLHRAQRCGFHNHHALLPRNQRLQTSLSIVHAVCLTVLFVHTGKTLEQMAEVFGDEVDAHDVLKSSAAHEKLDHEKLDSAKA